MFVKLKFLNCIKIQMLLVMISLLVIAPVSGSMASIFAQSNSDQQSIEMSHSLGMQHQHQHNRSIHDSPEMAGNGSHPHDGMSLSECCPFNCSAAIIADGRSKTIVNPTESHILPVHRLLLPFELDTLLRPPKSWIHVTSHEVLASAAGMSFPRRCTRSVFSGSKINEKVSSNRTPVRKSGWLCIYNAPGSVGLPQCVGCP